MSVDASGAEADQAPARDRRGRRWPIRAASAAGRWLAPSLFAALVAAVVAGLIDGARIAYDVRQTLAAAGFACLLTVPAGLAVQVAIRAIWAAWRPERLTAALTEERGGAPRLAGWIGFLGLAALLMAWGIFNGIRLVQRSLTLQPGLFAVMAAIVAIGVAGVAVVASRPAVDLLSALARWLDRRVERLARGRLRWSILRPRIVLAGAALALVGGICAAWRFTVRPRTGHVDLSILLQPALLLVTAAVAHAAWRRLVRRRAVAAMLLGAAAAVAAAGIAVAMQMRRSDPATMLTIWGEYSLAGTAIDSVYDLDVVRDEIHLAAFRPTPRPGAPHRDIILITVDTMRADRMPAYGGPAPMPAIQELARRGTVFDWAFSPGNVTRRSIPSIALGLSPRRVRGKVAGWALRLDPRHVLLAERFRAAGYDTAGFFCCFSFWGPAHKLGLNRGVQHLVIEPNGADLARYARDWLAERNGVPVPPSGGTDMLWPWARGAPRMRPGGGAADPRRLGGGAAEPRGLADGAPDMLRLDGAGADTLRLWAKGVTAGERPDRPAFVWVHFIEPHNWLKVSGAPREPKEDEEKRRLYDGVLGRVDGFIQSILEPLRKLPPERQPIIIITADHGEALGDHGQPNHSTDLYNSQIRVPLIIAGPGIGNRRIGEPIDLNDLAPTLLDLAGFEPPGMPAMDGRSLGPLLTGARPAIPDGGQAYSTMVKDRSVDLGKEAIVIGRWKLIVDDGSYEPELYDLRADPGENHNVAASQPQKVQWLMRELLRQRAIDAVAPF